MSALARAVSSAWFVWACRIAIGVLFGWAGLAKIADPVAFAADVHNFRMVPVALENFVAMTLPWIEVVTALALVLGVRARAGAWVATGLMVVFTVAVAVELARGIDIECGCFGTTDGARVGGVKVLENLGMTALAFLAAAPFARLARVAARSGGDVSLAGADAPRA
jgi:uncharacterized membrane protein YphA (DoxX/SURF4 family)